MSPASPAASSGRDLLRFSKRKLKLTAHVVVARQPFDTPAATASCQCPFHAGAQGGGGDDPDSRKVPVLYAYGAPRRGCWVIAWPFGCTLF